MTRLNASQRRGLIGALLLSLLILLIVGLYALWGESWQARVLYAAFVNLIVVIGLQTFMGNANFAVFSHAAFMGIAAYAAAICVTPVAMKAVSLPDAPWGLNAFEMSPLASALVALGITGTLGLLTGLFMSRLTGVGVTIVSIAILVIVHSIFLHRTDIFKGNQALFGIPRIFGLTHVTVLAIVAIFAARLFRESAVGLRLRAAADDEIGARAMGVDVHRARLVAWVVSTLFFAAAGIAYAFFLGTISARPFYFNFVFLTVAMLILGGLRSVSGAVFGTLLITIGLELVRWLETGPTLAGVKLPQMLGLSGLLLGVVIVAVMAFRPHGLMGNREIEDLVLPRKGTS
ncbi:branched-chain amino acid ABC transporter, permease protein [Oceanicola granulosus HTCC2516]|uniref:Branched-chain amino acid ABC transporter, permease protein n=1 Tax=Oceanicola granulosus (strain ATCC BAA-861 / DSM 15982 / KCTC 12143 / HTCC2516) TaxID=314256 RepID=Q2CEU0_OCEGH|nr:branched-chain amino acid ABC transporter permease [Oceanicola granulosus]EAR51168.1 branched-chain amino acid ABC transporter, permease protein [Oceanicola granulosus HTCC2516]